MIQGVAGLAAEIPGKLRSPWRILTFLPARPVGRVTLGVGVPGTLRNTSLSRTSRLTLPPYRLFPAAELTKTTLSPSVANGQKHRCPALHAHRIDAGGYRGPIAPPSTSFAETGPPVLSFGFPPQRPLVQTWWACLLNPTEDPRCSHNFFSSLATIRSGTSTTLRA